MKRIVLALLLIICSYSSINAQIINDTPTYRWDKIMTIRLSYADLKCRTNSETSEKVYQIYARTSNQFDNFCLTIGNINDAIQTIDYLIKYCEISIKGDNKSLNLADGKTLHIETALMIGQKYLNMSLSDCVGTANITLKELNKILSKLKEIKPKTESIN